MPTPATLSQLSELWLQESLGVFSQETLEHYSVLIDTLIIPHFGESVEISQSQVEEFIQAKMDGGLSERTTFTLVKLLRRILQYGAGHGYCPMPDWKLKLHTPQKKHAPCILSQEEEHRLSTYLTGETRPMHLCIFLILTCGFTVGEVLGIKWEDVSIKNNYIRVYVSRGQATERKNKTRKVPIGERQRIYLRKLMGAPESYICSDTGKPRNGAAIEARWKIICDALLLPPATLTDLRHTCAVRHLESGMSYADLASLLGRVNDRGFRAFYRSLVSPEARERLDSELLESRKERKAPEHINIPERDPESSLYRQKIAERRAELKAELDALEGDLSIIRTLRNSDCVQGANRQAFYNFIEKVLGDDKDGRYLVEYLRCNMRVADMPLLKETTVQTIRRRVTRGFEKLSAKLDQIKSTLSPW